MKLTVNTCNSSCLYSLCVLCLFLFWFFLGMNEVSLFLFHFPRTFVFLHSNWVGRWRGCMGTAETGGHSSQILDEKKNCSSSATWFMFFFNSQKIRFHSLGFFFFLNQCSPCTLPVRTKHDVPHWILRIYIQRVFFFLLFLFFPMKRKCKIVKHSDLVFKNSFKNPNNHRPRGFEWCELLFDGIQGLSPLNSFENVN